MLQQSARLRQSAQPRRTTQPGGRLQNAQLRQASPSSQPESLDASQLAPAQMASWLRNFLVVIALVGVVACAFVWQANDIADIRDQTAGLRQESARLERENAQLMVELAALDSPANIEAEAARLGITLAKPPSMRVTAVERVAVQQPASKSQPSQKGHAAIPEQITGWANRLAQRTTASELPR
jgi:hypothetical protein